MRQEQCLSERQKDCFCIAAILSILFIRFFQTIVLSKPISKFFLLAHWDSLFYPLRSGQNFSMDPSLVQYVIPSLFFVANCWHHGLPLWNQYSGFGMPLLADPQAFVFSPVGFIFNIFPGMHTWDLLLILKLVVGAISTYLLCRQFELNSSGSLIASLLFIFCPWLQWQLELLGKGICFMPLVLLVFVRLSKSRSLWDAVLAGIVAALDVLTAHPEIAFITILWASLLVFLTAFYNDRATFSFIGNCRKIVIAGLVAFGITAPMLIPFAEYLINGQSYKTALVASTGLPLQAILFNYMFPYCAKGSLFFGILSWWGLAGLCFLNKSYRFAVPLVICLCASIISVTRPMPFELLFSIPPLSMAFATYCLPEYVLFISIVSGLGISCLISNLDGRNQKQKIVAASVIGAMLLLLPLLFAPWCRNNLGISFDQTFALPRFEIKQWLFNAFFLLAMYVSIWLAITRHFARWKPLLICIFIILGLSNLFVLSPGSLPLRPTFAYPNNLPLKINIQEDSRIISVGNHLLKPNTNLIYRLPMVQVLNPMFPKGFLEFVRACGGKVDQYTQTFPLVINRLLNIAGVRTIVSLHPVLDQAAVPNQSRLSGKSAEYAGSIKLNNMQLLYDSKSRAVFCHLQVLANAKAKGGYKICLALEDFNGKPISYIEPEAIAAGLGAQEIYCSGSVPEKINHWQVSLKIFRDTDCSFITPISIPYGSVRANGAWLLGTSNQSNLFTSINNDRFKLMANGGGIFIYEDKKALPRQFFVRKIIWAKTADQALQYMQAYVSELNDVVVLDDKQKEQFYAVPSGLHLNKKGENDMQPIVYNNLGTVKRLPEDLSKQEFQLFPGYMLQTDAERTALLIISDLYYPGWKIYLDGSPWKMFRADYLFQAVVIPAGKHIIRFEYQPMSFVIGASIFIITVLVLLGCACAASVRRTTITK